MKDKDSDKTKEQLMRELEEMRRRVAELEASEAEYKCMEGIQLQDEQRLFAQGPVVVFKWRAGEGWPVEYVSPNVEGQFGYRPDDFTSGRILYRDIIHPDDVPHLFEELAECDKSGKEYLRQEYRIRSMDGSYRWVYDYTLLIKDDSGITTHYLGYITDITGHKQAEEKLRESEAKYRHLISDIGNMAIVEFDAEGQFTYVSPQTFDIFGYTPEELIEHAGLDFVHPDDVEKCVEAMAAKDEVVNFECRSVYKDGRYGYISITGKRVPDGRGGVNMISVLRDITERKRMEDELSASGERYRSVFENTGTATAIIEEDTIISLANEEFLNLSGYCREELEGKKSWCDFIVKEDLARMMQYHKSRRAEVGSAPGQYEFRFMDREGNTRDILLTVAMIPRTGKSVASLLDITGRKQAEEKLKMFSHATAGAIDGIAITDLEGNIIYANSAMEETYGYKRGELLGKPVFCLAAKVEVADEIMSAMIKTGSWEGEIEAIKGNKEIFPSLLSLSMVRDDAGNPTAMMGASRDITERRQAEEALRESEGKLNSMLRSISDPISMMDKDLNILWVNETTKSIFGEDIIGKKCYQVQHKRQKVCDDCPIIKAFEDGQSHGHETQVKDEDGNALHFQSSANVALRDKDGKPTAVIEISRDITELKRMEEELAQEHRLFMGGPTVVFKWIATYGWPIDYVSPNVYELSGYTAEELMDGTHLCLDMLHPDDIPRVAEENKMAEQQADCGQFATDYRILTKDGKIRWVHEHTMLVRDDEGAVKYHHGYVTDITEQKKAEAERQELWSKTQVTSRLASVGEMASGIAHEINNPLTSVLGFSELLLEKDLPEDLREDVEIIHNGSQRVAGIIQGLLTFARQHKPERTYTDINEIIESTLALKKYSLETGNIAVNALLDSGLPGTMADAGQLQQVFLNIIVNAEAEMKKARGRGKLTIKTERIDNTIRISFADDGPGIARENLEKVFDPFFTTREVGEGAGLGLSLSHGIIAEHNGALYVKSQIGKGATFFIELPIIAEERQLGLAEPADEIKGVSGGRILVVDDEPTILALLKDVLGGEGYDVETVSSGKEALGVIKKKRYGLIISDIRLPGLSGIELYDEIGKTSPSLQKRVMFITGDVISADTQAFLGETKSPYVSKPFDIARLKEEVGRILSKTS